ADPYAHQLDLKLVIDPTLVLIREDGMQHVFDYDPLLEQIHAISQNKHYETQEMLASRIVQCCASFKRIQSVEVCLKKYRSNGNGGTICGTIGVRLEVAGEQLAALRGNGST
ncbi:MAG TPA: dihydroneopterin aldolase, partial [Orrella sp.]